MTFHSGKPRVGRWTLQIGYFRVEQDAHFREMIWIFFHISQDLKVLWGHPAGKNSFTGLASHPQTLLISSYSFHSEFLYSLPKPFLGMNQDPFLSFCPLLTPKSWSLIQGRYPLWPFEVSHWSLLASCGPCWCLYLLSSLPRALPDVHLQRCR